MKSKKVATAIVGLLVFGMLGIALVTLGSTSELTNYVPMDVGPRLREITSKDVGVDFIQGEALAGMGAEGELDLNILDARWWISYNDFYGYVYWDVYYLVAESDLTEIWVQSNLNWSVGDPRPNPVVTQDQIDYLLDEFDSNIYPTDTDYFGNPDEHNGSFSVLSATDYEDEAARNVIMVSNVRDENFYDPTYPSYIAGFYWGLYEFYFDRNIINIDAYDWANRVGPDGSRPFLYEGTIAHEYQHLIHSDYVSGDATFINEGFSDFAELLCGYGAPWGHINAFLATPDNSLILWGDQGPRNILADYGAAALFAIYLNDQFGEDFIPDFLQAGIPGIAGLENGFPSWMNFDRVFQNWRVANLIDSWWPGYGAFNYRSIDLHGDDADPMRIYEVKAKDTPMLGTDFGNTITGYGNPPANTWVSLLRGYGTDYIRITHIKKNFKAMFNFDGWDEGKVSIDWLKVDEGFDQDEDLEWYSTTAGGYQDISIVGEFTLDSGVSHTLTIDTYYNIETGWDYGFVQVSTDAGATWTSLANDYTGTPPDPDAYGPIVAQLPGLSGVTDGWTTMDFDLSDYTGQTIMIRFRYMTDAFVQHEGWYLDNVRIDGVLVDNADDLVVFNQYLEQYEENDFFVTLVRVKKYHGHLYYTGVKTIRLDPTTESATKNIDHFLKGADSVILIVSPTTGYSDYEFSIEYKHRHHHKWWWDD
ncbi:MAG: hypothetical protein ACFFE8_06820 [Candidatus Heimdallarchaeota archaeon]